MTTRLSRRGTVREIASRCLCEGPKKTLTVREQKENAVSAHAIIHSNPAYDDVGEYGQGPKPMRITCCRR